MKHLLRILLLVVKWPIAIVSLFTLPFIAQECCTLLTQQFETMPLLFWAVVAGGLTVGWVFNPRFRATRLLTTMEHELIHVLLAWLSFLRVEKLEAQSDGNGLATIEAPANWLVFLGPYFIPLAMFFYAFILHALPLEDCLIQLGCAFILGYEATGNLREIHPQQTDFLQAGVLFTILFLPTAILVSYTGAMTYMVHGDLIQCWSQTGSLMVDGFDNAWRWAQQFM